MNRRKKKGSRRALRLSFAATFGILVLILVGSIYYTEFIFVPAGQLPASTPLYETSWAKFIPANVLQFSFQNFTYVNQLNSSLPFFHTLLHLTNPRAEVNSSDVRLFVSMEFEAPNASVDFAFLDPNSYAAFEAQFSGLQPYSHPVGNDSMYQVQDTATGKPVVGWVALVPQEMAVGFAPGLSEARQGLTQALMASIRTNSSVIGLPDVRQMLYLAGGASGYVGLGLNSFTGTIATSQKTMTAVRVDGFRTNLTRIVEFSDSSGAYAHYSTVKTNYPRASYVVVFNSYVRASQLDPLGELGGDYRLVQ
ncbi:MAG: hypothetical protein OK404_01735 [Thaumarchaeota archaeon]|nr:hypothetical protein [Nitrososphaerota archaeon]